MDKLLNLNASGIDISSKEHVVAVPQDRDPQSIRSFGTYTEDLHRLAAWLIKCRIDTVVMESTGVYWYHLYTVLLDHGIEVLLVNAQHVKQVPGRKSDISDARWLQQLHTYGLLRGCFQPDNLTRELRDHARLRKTIIRDMACQIQRAQKALELMNIKLNRVMRDITGKSGSAMIQAIIDGERDPGVLARMADRRLKASKQDILKALEGNWREEQVFSLRMAWQHYRFLAGQLQECDLQAEKVIQKFDRQNKEGVGQWKQQNKGKNRPSFGIREQLFQILGTDVMEIQGFKETCALTVFSETGTRLKEKFASPKRFLSWLNLVPENKVSGGKVISSKVRKKKNRAGQAFREAANALWRSKCPLGDYLRRKKAAKGANQAIVATARKIAAIYYKMVTEKLPYDNELAKKKGKENILRKIQYLERKLEQTKLQLTQ